MARAIPHLGEGELALQDGELVAEAGFPVGRGKGVGQPREPLAVKSLDFLFVELVGQPLRELRVGAAQKPVVQRLEVHTAALELALEVFVPVDAELGGVGKIGAELQEEGTEVLVHGVEVVKVHHRGGVVDPGDGALSGAEAFAYGARDGGLFLGDADKEDSLAALELAQVLLHDLVFALPLLKADDGDGVVVGEVQDAAFEGGAHVHGLLGGGEAVAQVVAEIGGHPSGAGELGDVGVEIHAVDGFQFEGDIFALEFGDTGG